MLRKRMNTILALIICTIIASLVVSFIPKNNVNYEVISELKNFEFNQTQKHIFAKILKFKASEINRVLEEQKQIEEEKRIKELELQKKPYFNRYNVTEPSNLSREQVHKMLVGTELIYIADSLYEYEKQYGVNCIFVASIIALESGYGTSSLAQTHNNLGGYKAKDGGYYVFGSWNECVQETFRLLSEEYLNEGGLYYNGKSVYDVNVRYCELDNWAEKIITIGNELLSKTN